MALRVFTYTAPIRGCVCKYGSKGISPPITSVEKVNSTKNFVFWEFERRVPLNAKQK